MRADRRAFIKIASLALLGLGAKPALDGLAGGDLAEASPSKAPASAAGRLALVIDLPKCLAAGDCTDCITACHAAHNVPRFEDPRTEVKWIWKERYERAFPDEAHPFTAAALRARELPMLCNHCDNPACARVCPTGATWKREDGIVMMDMHRCIGCRYCMVACPYGARSFNFSDPRRGLDMDALASDFPTRSRGVVEKCNFCAERIPGKLAPACVEACKPKAMAFGDLADPGSEVRKLLESRHSLRRSPGLGTSPQVYYLV